MLEFLIKKNHMQTSFGSSESLPRSTLRGALGFGISFMLVTVSWLEAESAPSSAGGGRWAGTAWQAQSVFWLAGLLIAQWPPTS